MLQPQFWACEGEGQEWSPRVTFHAPGSVWKCEGMNPHTPKWAPTLGVGVPMDSKWISKFLESNCKGQNPLDWNIFYVIGKLLKIKMSKIGSHDPFEYLKHKLWPKERSKVKLLIWLPTTNSWELPRFPCIKVACHLILENYRWWLQLCFKPHLNRRFAHKVIGLQSCGSLGTEWHFGVGPMAKHRKYYKGEDDGFT